MFQFTEDQYNHFRTFLIERQKENWGVWPPSTDWPCFPGMPAYSLNQYEQTNGKIFVVVKFDQSVRMPDNGFGDQTTGKRFKIGGDARYQPVCPQF